MNFTISEYEQNHVLVVMLLKLFGLSDRLFEKLCEVSRATKIRIFQYVSVLLENLLTPIKIGIIHPSIDREAMMNFIVCVKIGV